VGVCVYVTITGVSFSRSYMLMSALNTLTLLAELKLSFSIWRPVGCVVVTIN